MANYTKQQRYDAIISVANSALVLSDILNKRNYDDQTYEILFAEYTRQEERLQQLVGQFARGCGGSVNINDATIKLIVALGKHNTTANI